MGDIIFQKSIDGLVDNFQKCRKDIDTLNFIKDKFPNDILKIESEIKTVVSSIKTLNKIIEDAKTGLNHQLSDQNASQQSLKNEIHLTRGQFDKHVQGYEEHCKTSLTHVDRIQKLEKAQEGFALKASVADLVSNLNNATKKFDQEISQSKTSLKTAVDLWSISNAKTLEFATQTREDLLKKMMNFSSEYDDLKKAYEDHKKQISSQISSLSSSVISQIEQSISSQPKPFIPSLDEAKAAMKKELEPVILDAKNANLRSSNTENEIHILKKKIESLTLMMKKIELKEQI